MLTEENIQIRFLVLTDMPEVLAIEESVFENPWSEQEFRSHLRQSRCLCAVAVCEGRVVGYMAYEWHDTLIDLLSMAVASDFRHRNIGRQVVAKLVSKLSERRKRITLIIRDTNYKGQQFFRRCGFKFITTLSDHYDDSDELAHIMQYKIAHPAVRN